MSRPKKSDNSKPQPKNLGEFMDLALDRLDADRKRDVRLGLKPHSKAAPAEKMKITPKHPNRFTNGRAR